MKRITLMSIELTNFKGVHSLKLNFDRRATLVFGKNASGKTTLFDAFTWVLFGKDSAGRKQFDIKTLDKNGVPIPRLPHEVTAVLDVDGEIIRLTRRYSEKWQKRRGTTTEEFTGHEEERLYNDVPMSVRDWEEKISGICPERDFKLLTNPMFFCSQPKDTQRAMLIAMANDVTYEDIAKSKDSFAAVIEVLRGRSIEDVRKELGAKKKRIRKEADGIPPRIDEIERSTSLLSAEDFDKKEKESNNLKLSLMDVEKRMFDGARANEEIVKKRQSMIQQIGEIRERNERVKQNIIGSILSEREDALIKRRQKEAERNAAQAVVDRIKTDIIALENKKEDLARRRESLLVRWRACKNETFDEGSLFAVCPTCGHLIEGEEREEKLEKMREAFNKDKARRIAENEKDGCRIKEKIEENDNETKRLADRMAEAEREMTRLSKDIESINVPPLIDSEAVAMCDDTYRANISKISEIEAELKNVTAVLESSFSDLAAEKKRLQGEIDKCNEVLSHRQIIESNVSRIEELRGDLRSMAQAIADMENTEEQLIAFNKAYMEGVEKSVNALFAFTRFRLFETQINGAEVETCEASVDGVPYTVLNNAMRINCGLDIINAITQRCGISAPIIIDNSESVNSFTPTIAQMIHLYVSDDDVLTIK